MLLSLNFIFCRSNVDVSIKAQTETTDNESAMIASFKSSLPSLNIGPLDGVLDVQVNQNISISASLVAQGCKNF